MTTTIPRVIALAPSGLTSAGPVVAACRAGALGAFDFGIGYQAKAAIAAALNVARYNDQPFGLRLSADELDWALLERIPPSLRVLICTEPNNGDWTGPLTIARRSGRPALAEVTSRASAHSATLAGAEALIVAGHEAGGRGAEESTLILLQGVLAQGGPPVWVRGGIGPRSAAACLVAGAAGVVLDGALLLARESPLEPAYRERITRWDGGETVVLGRSTGHPLRVHARPGSPVLTRLQTASEEGLTPWERAVQNEVGWKADQSWPVGQDAALAAPLARRFGTVGGIIQAVEQAIDSAPRQAKGLRPFAEGSPLAVSHRTRYPVVQGPMTRVSDSGAFAKAVADGGALPFLALALLRGPDVRALLTDVAERLAGQPWGVGLLGFVPNELRAEQVAAILDARPPFALIAGGRPDQARDLERHGIPTYLHAPSPALLRQYLKDGARRFVLEGRECGGHVGPRSSLVLWEQAVEVVMEAVNAGLAAEEVHLLFAGGLHDARSAAAVAALAVPLAELGVKLGLLVGTAYLFTAEAVNTGAIVPGFQVEALKCSQTVLLETGPGHEVRVSPTPFAARFTAERRRLLAEGRPPDEIRETLETLNTGRLRVAAKGVDRAEGRGSLLVPVSPDAQHARGVYMLGQVATLRDRVTTIAELHQDLCEGSSAWLDQEGPDVEPPEIPAQPADIAIIGMAAILPGAANVHAFWENTLNGIDSIIEIPADRWDWRTYYDPDPKAPDKITSKWGGFLPEVPFDPLRYGMPPSSIPSIEPMQMLVLETVRSALDDAGYRERPFPKERTAVVLGAGGGAAQLAMGYAFRSYLPLLDTAMPGAGREAIEQCKHLLPEWTEDSFPGILLNVAAGRVANRFDLGGANYTVDAACGSSLAAAALAVRELESGAADMVILGGADTVQNPFTYLAFSKTHAFSPRGRCRPFDEGADGIVISEGVAALVLKRLADAERDGDRIYAVLKGLGASSDGRAKGLTAPRPEGQVSALKRAYARSGVSPATVGYVEAHGTGTAAGDLAEVHALSEIFEAAGAGPGACALGSVKSLIGHTKCAAGLAGLINASLALHHQVIPPTIGIQTPNPRAHLSGSPFRLNTTPTPWLHTNPTTPRRAGVSAFGFGGTNFHAVLEAYDRDPTPAQAPARDWPAELLVWQADDRKALAADLDRWSNALDQADPTLRDLAHTLADRTSKQADRTSNGRPVLAIVADSLDDLRSKLNQGRKAVADGTTELNDPRGVFFAEQPAHSGAKVAFLFPGQGSQTPRMLNDLAIAFPEARQAFETFDAALLAIGKPAVGPLVFPPPSFSDLEREAQRAALAATNVAQSAVGAASTAMLHVLQALGVRPDLVAGHSYGELVALHAGGVMTAEALAKVSEGRGRLIMGAIDGDPGTMAALTIGPDRLGEVLDGLLDVAPVNFNGPRQTVVSGTTIAVTRALDRARTLGIRAHPLAVPCAFHSPLVADAQGPLTTLARTLGLASPCLPVYSNVNAKIYPSDPNQIARQVGEHLAKPVRFSEMIAAMAADGASVFVEVGPGSTLSPLVDSILGDRPHLAVSTDRPNQAGVHALLLAIGRLVAAGVPMNLNRLTADRSARVLDLDAPATWTNLAPLPPSAWLVNGSRARPATAPEPPRFGVGPALPAPAQPPALRNGSTSHSIQNGVHHHPGPAADPGPSRVVEAFQETMRAFLQTQRATMLDYLASRATEHNATPNGSKSIPDSRFPTPSDLKFQTSKHDHPLNRISSSLDKVANSKITPHENIQNTSSNHKQEHLDINQRGLDRDEIASRLLRIVQDRTGYPAEVLRLDLDMEADLGIDSIKRVEILGSLRDAVVGLDFGPDGDVMDQLSRAKTLGAIVDRLERASRSPMPTDHPPTQRNGQTESPAQEPLTAPVDHVRRLLIEVVNAPLSRS
ncbi:MAG: beta-ketoacyl synthase N-terminal-like domain-containing protein, partial [Isosphaeraceae bacterium]